MGMIQEGELVVRSGRLVADGSRGHLCFCTAHSKMLGFLVIHTIALSVSQTHSLFLAQLPFSRRVSLIFPTKYLQSL
jgi:hypothetical protein